jgi:hypothetical protein
MDSKTKSGQVVKLKVIDFTLWNGFKFGVGFALGGIAVSIVFAIGMFILRMFATIGLPTY